MFVYIMNINFLNFNQISRIDSDAPIIDDIQIIQPNNPNEYYIKVFPYDIILTNLYLDPYIQPDIDYSKPLANPNTKRNFVLNVSTNHSLYKYKNDGVNLDDNKIYFPRFYISSLYKENDQYKENDEEKFINDLNTINNNEKELILANKNRLYPELYYIGNLLAKNGNVYRFSIMEKYDMTLKEYIESYDPLNDMTVDLTHLLNTLVDKMNILYYDINLDNCFVKILDDEIILKLGNLKPEKKLYIPNNENIKGATRFFYLIIFAYFLYKNNKNFLYKIIKSKYGEYDSKIELWKDIYCDPNYYYGKTIINIFYNSQEQNYNFDQSNYDGRRIIINDAFDKLFPMVTSYGAISALSGSKARSDSFGSLLVNLEMAQYDISRKGGKRKHFKKKYSRKRIKH